MKYLIWRSTQYRYASSKAYLQTNVDFLQLVHFHGYSVSFLWNFDNTKDIDRYVVSEGDWMKKNIIQSHWNGGEIMIMI